MNDWSPHPLPQAHRPWWLTALRALGFLILFVPLFTIVALLPSAITFVVVVLLRFDPALALLAALGVGIVWAFAFD